MPVLFKKERAVVAGAVTAACADVTASLKPLIVMVVIALLISAVSLFVTVVNK